MTLRPRRARARAHARARAARRGVRELLALIDTAEENRRWEFLIYQAAGRPTRAWRGSTDSNEPQQEGISRGATRRQRRLA